MILYHIMTTQDLDTDTVYQLYHTSLIPWTMKVWINFIVSIFYFPCLGYSSQQDSIFVAIKSKMNMFICNCDINTNYISWFIYLTIKTTKNSFFKEGIFDYLCTMSTYVKCPFYYMWLDFGKPTKLSH